MIKHFFIGLLVLCSLFACNKNEKLPQKTTFATDSLEITTAASDATKKEVIVHTDDTFDFHNTVLHQAFKDSIYMRFSDNDLEDFFTFEIPEGNINKTTAVLKIFSQGGELLYEKSFTTYGLIGDDTYTIKNDDEMEKYIISQAKEVLAKDSFNPIDDPKKVEEYGIFNQPKEEFENYAVFKECQKEKRLLFSISSGYEDITYIGYSRKLGKVVDIIYCC